jgi:hypothetical protein
MKRSRKKHLDYPAIPEFDTPRYLLGDIAAAAEVAPGTLKAWLSREPKVIPLGPYDPASRGKGISRLFTLRRAFAIAMTSELVSLGLAPSSAGDIAFDFTDGRSPDSDFLKTLEMPGPLFFVLSASPFNFHFFDSNKHRISEIMDPSEAGGERSVSAAVVDCAALMKRLKARLKERGA